MKTLNKLLSSSTGFSMVELMVGGAMLAGVGLISATLFKNQKSSQKAIDHVQELNNFHKNVSDILTKVNNCNATFASSYDKSAIENITEIKECKNCDVSDVSKDAKDSQGTKIFAVGDYVKTQGQDTRYWFASNLQIVRPADADKTGVNKLLVTYEVNPNFNKDGAPQKMVKEIIINARFHDGKFKSCYDSQQGNLNNLSSNLCSMFKSYKDDEDSAGHLFEWNEESQSCVAVENQLTCPDKGESMVGISDTGEVTCLKIVDQMNAWELPDSNQTTCLYESNISITFSSGTNKLMVGCTPGKSTYGDKWTDKIIEYW